MERGGKRGDGGSSGDNREGGEEVEEERKACGGKSLKER